MLTLLRYLASPTFRVSVGEGTMKKNFYVHRGIAASRATLFKDALKGSVADADGLTVSLPEEDPEIFLLYMQTLYVSLTSFSSDFCTETDDSIQLGQVQVTNANHKFLALSKALVLAAKLKDNKAEAMMLNAILDHSKSAAFTGGTSELPDLDAVAIIYRGTAPTDPARALLVKLYTNMVKELPPAYEGGHRDIHPEFMSDLLQSVLANRPFPEVNGTTGPLKDGHVGPRTRPYLPVISEPILSDPPIQTPSKVKQSASIPRSANSGSLLRVPGDSKPPVTMSRPANSRSVVLDTKSEVPSNKKSVVGTSRSSSPNIRLIWLDSNFRIAKDKKSRLSAFSVVLRSSLPGSIRTSESSAIMDHLSALRNLQVRVEAPLRSLHSAPLLTRLTARTGA